MRKFCIDNLLVRIHFIIVMIRWTGLAPWEFEFGARADTWPGSLWEVLTAPAKPWTLRTIGHPK